MPAEVTISREIICAIFVLQQITGINVPLYDGTHLRGSCFQSGDSEVDTFTFGVGGTGWLIQGEMFLTGVRGQAAAPAATVDRLADFTLIGAFPASQRAIGLGWVMVGFAALYVLGQATTHATPTN